MFIEYKESVETKKFRELREKQRKANPGKYYHEHSTY